jgi:hypothetical protein
MNSHMFLEVLVNTVKKCKMYNIKIINKRSSCSNNNKMNNINNNNNSRGTHAAPIYNIQLVLPMLLGFVELSLKI